MSDDDKGRVTRESMVGFTRMLPGPIERVWEHLTSGNLLAGWLGEGTIEPRACGLVNLLDGHIRGVVTQWQPPRRLGEAHQRRGRHDAAQG